MRSYVMISLQIVILAVCLAEANMVKAEKIIYDVSKGPQLFEEFIQKFDRKYIDDKDKDTHYQIFLANLHKINELNAKSKSATYGINKFADYSKDEMKVLQGFKKPE